MLATMIVDASQAAFYLSYTGICVQDQNIQTNCKDDHRTDDVKWDRLTSSAATAK